MLAPTPTLCIPVHALGVCAHYEMSGCASQYVGQWYLQLAQQLRVCGASGQLPTPTVPVKSHCTSPLAGSR